MKYRNLHRKPDAYFQRKTGVKKPTFAKMVEVVNSSVDQRKTRRGKVATFSVEDQILIMLQYYREYPTFFSLGDTWGLHESTAQRTVRRIEDILIKNGTFSLPGDKGLANLIDKDLVLVDVTESPVERPKKSNEDVILGKRKNILSKLK
ncbi:MAG: hypothetical protein ACD_19C00410G0009 [uncultured bacterium]|nr:MAG: hypothetical protein ACD_19C00410G0009 [uncultured bacterium]